MTELNHDVDFPAPEIERPPQEDLDFSDAWAADDPLDEDLALLSMSQDESLSPSKDATTESAPSPKKTDSSEKSPSAPPPRRPTSPPRKSSPAEAAASPPPPRPPPGPRPPTGAKPPSPPPKQQRGPPPKPRPSPPKTPAQPSPPIPLNTTTTTTTSPENRQLVLHSSSQQTPPRSSSSPRFAFLSEEKKIPTQLHHLEETSVRRRHEFQSNVHDLECRVAALTASLAQEQMERERSLSKVLATDVYQRLEDATEELFLERSHDDDDNNNTKTPNSRWIQLEARLSRLDTQMTHSVHVGMENEKRSKLEELQDELEHYVQPAFQLETHKADKREGTLFKRWEEAVSLMARRFQEEHAARLATLEWAAQQMESLELLQQQKELLPQILALRQRLDQERVARQAQDVQIRQRIAQRERLMKEAMLEAVGGASSSSGV